MSRGYFGVAIYHPRHDVNVGGLWRSAAAFGAAFTATVGARYSTMQASDTSKTRLHIPLFHHATIDELIERLPHSCPLVGVELDPRAVPLERFHHPDRAVYLLGAEDHGLPPSVTDRCHHLVQVSSSVSWSLNVATAGSIVLHDRHTKQLARRAAVAS